MEWESSTGSSKDAKPREFHLREWLALSETRSRSAEPVFTDIATQVFAGALPTLPN